MARPKKKADQKRVSTLFRLPRETLKKLQDIAYLWGSSTSNVIARCIDICYDSGLYKHGIDNLTPEQKAAIAVCNESLQLRAARSSSSKARNCEVNYLGNKNNGEMPNNTLELKALAYARAIENKSLVEEPSSLSVKRAKLILHETLKIGYEQNDREKSTVKIKMGTTFMPVPKLLMRPRNPLSEEEVDRALLERINCSNQIKCAVENQYHEWKIVPYDLNEATSYSISEYQLPRCQKVEVDSAESLRDRFADSSNARVKRNKP